MADTKTGGPAFPSEGEGHGNPKYWSPGMNLRDWFAGQALAGMMADPRSLDAWTHDEMTRESYLIADAMLAARGES